LIILAESRSLRRKLVHHPANAGKKRLIAKASAGLSEDLLVPLIKAAWDSGRYWRHRDDNEHAWEHIEPGLKDLASLPIVAEVTYKIIRGFSVNPLLRDRA
jgi:hypothetical protein